MNPVLKRIVTGLAVSAAVIAAILLVPVCVFTPAVSILAALAIFEYELLLVRRTRRLSFAYGWRLVLGAFAILVGLSAIPAIAQKFGNVMLLYVLAIVKFSDTGGFAFGLTSAKLMKGGNHKLCPSISPNKSWEGLLGSVVFATIVSLAFIPWTHFDVLKAVLFGIAAAFLGTAGDLVESKFKRWVGVKDSSTLKITNGMGGILDMLDSLFFAPLVLASFI